MSKVEIKKEYLKKDELFKRIAEENETTKKVVEGVFKSTENIILEELQDGKKVVIPGLVTVKPGYRPETVKENAINPATGVKGTIVIKEKYKVNFKVNKSFEEKFNEAMKK